MLIFGIIIRENSTHVLRNFEMYHCNKEDFQAFFNSNTLRSFDEQSATMLEYEKKVKEKVREHL